jgi:tungstate transport system substrate-binding protein
MCCLTVGRGFQFKNGGDLQMILVEGDRRLFNQYDVLLVNPAKHPNVKKNSASNLLIG